jgi:hypothetical protein
VWTAEKDQHHTHGFNSYHSKGAIKAFAGTKRTALEGQNDFYEGAFLDDTSHFLAQIIHSSIQGHSYRIVDKLMSKPHKLILFRSFFFHLSVPQNQTQKQIKVAWNANGLC